MRIYSIKSGQVQHKIKKHTDWVTSVAFRPDGEMLASADRNGGISIWDSDNAQEMYTLPGHKSAVTSLSWRGDSKLLASASEDGTVKLWEMKEGKQVKSWTAHGAGVSSVSYSHDGRFVTCGRDNAVTLWDSNGNKQQSLKGVSDLPLRAVFSHDDERVFGTDFSGHIDSWLAKDGKSCGALNPNPRPLMSSLPGSK